MGFLQWLLGREISPRSKTDDKHQDKPTTERMIIPLLIYPRDIASQSAGELTMIGADRYFLSAPIEVPRGQVQSALVTAKTWLDVMLGIDIPWAPLREIASNFSVVEWRSAGIGLLEREVREASMPWTDDFIYLAFVRSMGGYAGGIKYERGRAGHAMVGDVCLESICHYPEPNATSALLGEGWPSSSRSAQGQTAAFLHETLHGFDLPHPDGWPVGEQPRWEETIMGYWWDIPDFSTGRGLTPREVHRASKWLI